MPMRLDCIELIGGGCTGKRARSPGKSEPASNSRLECALEKRKRGNIKKKTDEEDTLGPRNLSVILRLLTLASPTSRSTAVCGALGMKCDSRFARMDTKTWAATGCQF
jgi:hypothetical protein